MGKLMKKTLCALSLYLLLSGCELVYVPLAIVSSPVILATELATESARTKSSITQPITVVASDGSALAGPTNPNTKPESKFTVPNRALTCKGSVTSSSKTEKPVYIPVRCSNGLKGTVRIKSNEFAGYRISFWSGPQTTPRAFCAANFYLTGDAQGPFQVECSYRVEQWTDFTKTKKEEIKLAPQKGAALVGVTLSGSYQATVWIPKAP